MTKKKIDALFWAMISILPIILYCITNYRNPDAIGFFEFVGSFAPFEFIQNIMDEVARTAFGRSFEITQLLAYCVGVEIFHVLFDIIVFIPRLAHKWISKAVQDE